MDETVIVCLPWDDVVEPVPGSEVRWCSLCGSEISVSPDGLALIDTSVARPVCLDCGIGLTDLDVPEEMYSRRGGEDVPIPGDAGRAAMKLIREQR